MCVCLKMCLYTISGNQLKRELNANNMVLLDLPTGHDLRKNLETTQSQYQQILEKSATHLF